MKPRTTESSTKVLIGSAAVNAHDPAILKREAKDKDFLSLEKMSGVNIDWIDGAGIVDAYPFGEIATLDEVYTLKVSHSFWIITYDSWHKHLHDIRCLQEAGAKLIPELYELAYAEWERRKGVKKIDLNQDKTEFFGRGVRRMYEHDSVHEAVAFQDKPLFTKILADNAEVLTSRKKFEQLPEEEKKMLVEEEVSVLALERELIPKMRDIYDRSDLYVAYGKQLRLLITQYSKGYFPLWIVENFFSVHKPTRDYWKVFQESDKKVLIASWAQSN